MISAGNAALVERARIFFTSQADEEMLAYFPADGCARDLTKPAFESLMDLCTVQLFKDRRRPILSLHRLRNLEAARVACKISDLVWTTNIRRLGASDHRELDGYGYLRLVAVVENINPAMARLIIDDNREITPKQVRLVHTALGQVALSSERFLQLLQIYGAVNSVSDLDRRGLNLIMAVLKINGFKFDAGSVSDHALGRRPGFASPEQLGLIRVLWREWSGSDDELALASWLERFHHVSALRFLSTGAAGKVITALKAMKRRPRSASSDHSAA